MENAQQTAAQGLTPEQKTAMETAQQTAAQGSTPEQKAAMENAQQTAHSSDSSGMDDPYKMLAEVGLTPADLGVKIGAEHGDKCNGFKMMLTAEKMARACEALDTESACKANEKCEWDGHEDCDVSPQAGMDAMGIKMDAKKLQADVTANPAGAKDILKKVFVQMIPLMNDFNATQKDVKALGDKCKDKAKDACEKVDVCEVNLAKKEKYGPDGRSYEMVEECDVNGEKAIKTIGECSGMNKMLADNIAAKKRNAAAQAKKVLAKKKTALETAKKAVEDYKKANPNAKAETDTKLKELVATQTTADASVKTASTQAATAETAAKTAEQKANDTPDDSNSALRALPSVMAVVAATVAAAFA